ncbi:protein lethal(2)essential for life-like [Aricia agestis]|uniref:protein lethal(2)essential for life-like n=1 Tax=Aricia agestis TaxID=91739 RepID=UPI001C207405|nr:protein lethal(2)essential for life-like [Aricia agestis]
MSLLPYMLGYDWPRHRPSHLFDQDFGLGLTPDDVLTIVAAPMPSRNYVRPWRQLAQAARDVGSSIKADKDKFQVNLDVQHFAPEEISVKTADGYIVVEGKHEEKQDEHGYISRQFVRRYALPEGCNPDTVESRLSSDGVLTVTAPRKQAALKNEKPVPIQQTGPVRKEVKDQEEKNLHVVRDSMCFLAQAARDVGSSIKADKDKFQVNLDVQHFAPEEISVKTADGYIVVEGKHEEKQDEHGYISRQFVRRYALPDGCNVDAVESRLSSDGVLTITAPRQQTALKNERSVPIQQTGPVRKEIKDENKEEKEEKK